MELKKMILAVLAALALVMAAGCGGESGFGGSAAEGEDVEVTTVADRTVKDNWDDPGPTHERYVIREDEVPSSKPEPKAPRIPEDVLGGEVTVDEVPSTLD